MGEIIYEALAQYITIFFFVVMVLPAVIIFCGYLIYIVVMCIRELKKKIVSICMEKAPTQDLLHRCFS